MSTLLPLLQLLRLASPQLPIGGYSYSQGLEWAIDSGLVHDESSAERWLVDQLLLNLARFEAPLLLAHCRAADECDWTRLQALAEHGREGFYNGPIAERLIKGVRHAGGIWTEDDLREYRIARRAPLHFPLEDGREQVSFERLVVRADFPASGTGRELALRFERLQEWFQIRQRTARDFWAEAQ